MLNPTEMACLCRESVEFMSCSLLCTFMAFVYSCCYLYMLWMSCCALVSDNVTRITRNRFRSNGVHVLCVHVLYDADGDRIAVHVRLVS